MDERRPGCLYCTVNLCLRIITNASIVSSVFLQLWRQFYSAKEPGVHYGGRISHNTGGFSELQTVTAHLRVVGRAVGLLILKIMIYDIHRSILADAHSQCMVSAHMLPRTDTVIRTSSLPLSCQTLRGSSVRLIVRITLLISGRSNIRGWICEGHQTTQTNTLETRWFRSWNQLFIIFGSSCLQSDTLFTVQERSRNPAIYAKVIRIL
jgi:hypothetical protein